MSHVTTGMSDDMDSAVKFLPGDRDYPEGYSENLTIWNWAGVLRINDGEVFYFKGKNAEGKKIEKQLLLDQWMFK